MLFLENCQSLGLLGLARMWFGCGGHITTSFEGLISSLPTTGSMASGMKIRTVVVASLVYLALFRFKEEINISFSLDNKGETSKFKISSIYFFIPAGKAKTAVISACRQAIKNNNVSALAKIIRMGSS